MRGEIKWVEYYDTYNWWSGKIWLRFKAAIRLLFAGWIELEECFLFAGSAHVDSLIAVLKDCRDRIKAWEDNPSG